MAEMNSANLAQRVRQAEDRLAQSQREAEEERRRLTEEQIELRVQMQEMVASCNAAMVRMQESVNEALRTSEENHRRALSEMEEKRRSLEEEMKRERERREREKKMALQAAQQALSNARKQMETVLELPCEFFAAGHYEAIREQLKQADALFEKELGQAAAALADSAATDAVVLAEQVREASEEWELLFSQYKGRVDGISEERKRFVSEAFGREQQPISEEDRVYWSSGAWSAHSEKVDELVRVASNMNVKDMSTRPMKVSQLIRAMSDAGQIDDQQRALMHCIREERRFSDERYYLAQDLLTPLEEAGFNITYCGFVQDEPIDSYEIVLGTFEEGMEDILIALMPVRRDGVAVRNEIVLSMIHDTFSREQTGIYMDAIERAIGGAADKTPIRRIGSDTRAAASAKADHPNPQRQIQLHERRYH